MLRYEARAIHWQCAENRAVKPHSNDGLYIGLMSGTSADGVDAALVNIERGSVTFREAASTPYPEHLQERLLALNTAGTVPLPELIRLDLEVASAFAATAAELVLAAGGSANVVAIGSHGQTIFHQPEGPFPGTLQIGNASVIAKRTGIDTVADFRSADMACGGQGAPLTPAFNQAVFSTTHSRVILNLGGIANLTFLAGTDAESSGLDSSMDNEPGLCTQTVGLCTVTTDSPGKYGSGFDTGPANTLMDAWIKQHLGEPYDADGNWAKSGSCDTTLLKALLSDTYFDKKPPKSTGPDYFNMNWVNRYLQQLPHEPEPRNVQATLLELTAISVAKAIVNAFPNGVEVVLCGGGAHNRQLRERLAEHCAGCTITTTDDACGLQVDHCESVAFAWLAYRYLAGLPGNLPAVTGAAKPVILGAMHKAG